MPWRTATTVNGKARTESQFIRLELRDKFDDSLFTVPETTKDNNAKVPKNKQEPKP
jgi:hypothetical protein